MSEPAERPTAEPAPPSRRGPAANPAKASFLRLVSHELRTPLNAIIGFSELIGCELYGPLGAPQYKEYAGIIHDSGHKLLKLVNQILEVVRLQDDAAELDLAPQRLEHAVDDAMELVAADIAARGARVEVERRLQMPWAHADAKALRTILANLIQNAALYGGEAPVVVVRARRRAPTSRSRSRTAARAYRWRISRAS